MAAKESKLGDKAKSLVRKARKTATAKARAAADLNADGKIDAEDRRIAAEWTKSKAVAVGKGGSKIAKAALHTDVGKAAAIGAAVAVPVPVVGPLAGAAVGAGVGVYTKLKKKRSSPVETDGRQHHSGPEPRVPDDEADGRRSGLCARSGRLAARTCARAHLGR